MSGVFQPKVIIGSVVGFIATAIGVIAVFFPSLFNLETKKIVNYEATLTTENDYLKLINFLKENQNKIVHLDLTYLENDRWRWEQDDKGETIYKDDEPIKEELNHEGDGLIEGKMAFGTVDEKGHVFIASQFTRFPYLQNFLRKNGGFGVWVEGAKEDGSEDHSYFIAISRDSDGNKLYKWSMKNRDKNIEEMQLLGTFFVNQIIEDKEYANKDVSISMSTRWYDEMCGPDSCNSISIIDLEPLSKKEIESKNY